VNGKKPSHKRHASPKQSASDMRVKGGVFSRVLQMRVEEKALVAITSHGLKLCHAHSIKAKCVIENG